ncbi:hypothetical protein MES4922_410026 [Mesorhizobium ventifaucium]|uniref:Uncharacterized protein n=1 Tax=Mesorhizobium ventifaucium TaxID=666020 RepID=A0ABN8K6M3_9HYPH|nr:hypothetical protein MES4922_410026 [Mesorhizobium ventifaucium]
MSGPSFGMQVIWESADSVSESEIGLCLELTPRVEQQPRCFEMINGAVDRRRWSTDDKARSSHRPWN